MGRPHQDKILVEWFTKFWVLWFSEFLHCLYQNLNWKKKRHNSNHQYIFAYKNLNFYCHNIFHLAHAFLIYPNLIYNIYTSAQVEGNFFKIYLLVCQTQMFDVQTSNFQFWSVVVFLEQPKEFWNSKNFPGDSCCCGGGISKIFFKLIFNLKAKRR